MLGLAAPSLTGLRHRRPLRPLIRGDASAVRRGAYLEGGAKTRRESPFRTRSLPVVSYIFSLTHHELISTARRTVFALRRRRLISASAQYLCTYSIPSTHDAHCHSASTDYSTGSYSSVENLQSPIISLEELPTLQH